MSNFTKHYEFALVTDEERRERVAFFKRSQKPVACVVIDTKTGEPFVGTLEDASPNWYRVELTDKGRHVIVDADTLLSMDWTLVIRPLADGETIDDVYSYIYRWQQANKQGRIFEGRTYA